MSSPPAASASFFRRNRASSRSYSVQSRSLSLTGFTTGTWMQGQISPGESSRAGCAPPGTSSAGIPTLVSVRGDETPAASGAPASVDGPSLAVRLKCYYIYTSGVFCTHFFLHSCRSSVVGHTYLWISDILLAVNGEASPYRRKAEALGTYVCTPTGAGSATPPLLLSREGFGGTLMFCVGIRASPTMDSLRESGRNPEIVRLSRHGGGHAASVGCTGGRNRQKCTAVTRVTPGVNAGILSLNQDSRTAEAILGCGADHGPPDEADRTDRFCRPESHGDGFSTAVSPLADCRALCVTTRGLSGSEIARVEGDGDW
jgi:hypothetical protein